MKIRFLFLFSLAAGISTLSSFSQASNLVDFVEPAGVKLFGASSGRPATVFEVDPVTGGVSNEQPVSPPSEIYSLATEPVTNRIFCVYQEGIDQEAALTDENLAYELLNQILQSMAPLSLGTINPATGAITKVSDFSYGEDSVFGGIPGITFDCDGNLYAVSGGQFPDGNNSIQTSPVSLQFVGLRTGEGLIFSVDPATAELDVIATGSTGGAHSLEFNPEDGLLYHFFAPDNMQMETIDPEADNPPPTPVSLTGDMIDGIQAVVFAGNGIFLGHRGGRDSFYAITSAGVVGYVGPSPGSYGVIRGLAYSKAIGCLGFQPDLLIGKGTSNLKKDDFYTKTGRQQTIRGVLLKGRVGSSIEIPLEVQNDGSAHDRIRLRWNITNQSLGNKVGTGPRFRRQVFLDRRNVTASIRQKGLSLDPGEKRRLKFKLSVEREPARRVSKRSATFRAISRNDRSKTDVGKSIITIKK